MAMFLKGPKRSPSKLTQEIGISYADWDKSGRGDAEFIPSLSGKRGIRVYRQMSENDATISTILFAIEMSLRSVDWRIDPNPENDTSDEDIEFIEGVLFRDMDCSFLNFVAEALSFLTYGWSIHEKVFKLRQGDSPANKMHRSIFNDGKIGIRRLSLRPQSSLHRWLFDDMGNVEGFEQFTTTSGIVKIPIDKCFYIRTPSIEGAPEGRSMLRGAYRSWFLMKNLEEVESNAIERELNGLPVIYVPQELLARASEGDQGAMNALNKYNEAARDVKFNKQGSLVLPSDCFQNQDGSLTTNRKVLFELAASNGTRNIDTNTVINRYQASIMRTVMADFILLGSSSASSGSYSLGMERSQLFADVLSGWLDLITDAFNKQVMTQLWAVNGMNIDNCPVLSHGPINRESLASLSDYIKNLAAAGMPLFPDQELESFLRKQADLPEISEELDDIREAKGQPDPDPLELMRAKEGLKGKGDDKKPPPKKSPGKSGK